MKFVKDKYTLIRKRLHKRYSVLLSRPSKMRQKLENNPWYCSQHQWYCKTCSGVIHHDINIKETTCSCNNCLYTEYLSAIKFDGLRKHRKCLSCGYFRPLTCNCKYCIQKYGKADHTACIGHQLRINDNNTTYWMGTEENTGNGDKRIITNPDIRYFCFTLCYRVVKEEELIKELNDWTEWVEKRITTNNNASDVYSYHNPSD